MLPIVKKLIDRFKEPSSLAGLSTIALAFGISQPIFEVWMQAIVGILALASLLMSEKGGTPPPPA